MIRLADVDPPIAATLLDRLETAGIVATTTDLGQGSGGIFGLQRGGLQLRVWIQDAARESEARAILHEVLAAPRSSMRCPGCGYDLGGHAGATTCPECGMAVLAEAADAAAVCPACGEENPPEFEVCWKCGGDLPVALVEAVDGGDAVRSPVNACPSCGAEVRAGAASCPTCGAGIEAAPGFGRRSSPGGWIALAFVLLFVLVTLLRGGW